MPSSSSPGTQQLVPTPSQLERRRNRRLRLVLRHVVDYVVLVAIIGGALKLGSHGPLAHRPFSLTDISIAYPYLGDDIISDTVLIALVALVPICISVLLALVAVAGSWREKLREAHTSCMSLLMSVGLALLLSGGCKLLYAKPRPDFLSRCQPSTSLNSTALMTTYHICTQTDIDIINDGYGSFPSKHSAVSFAGLGILALVLAARLGVWDQDLRQRRRNSVWNPSRPACLASSTLGAWRMLIVLIPILGATIISLTRIFEYKHHPVDVLIGALLGVAIACFSYRFYYPRWSYTPLEGAPKPLVTAVEHRRDGGRTLSTVLDISPQATQLSFVRYPTEPTAEDLEMGLAIRGDEKAPAIEVTPASLPIAAPILRRGSHQSSEFGRAM